jgi:hypothetical protein
MDGKQTPFRIERFNLRPIIKGPEALLTPSRILQDDQRLFDVRLSKDDLRARHANGTLTYLRRGETVEYKVSEDSLKGGIPAARSNIKNRKPFWYSVGVPQEPVVRLAIPEHHDKRYMATVIPQDSEAVVIDTCYAVHIKNPTHAAVIHASLNSILAWYQLELRGRTQHGEGVLKVKIPDWSGVLVLNPDVLNDEERAELLEQWMPLSDVDPGPALDALGDESRIAFNRTVVGMCGIPDPDDMRLNIERELRAAVAERQTRRESVVEAKRDRTPARRATASVDAYASRIAAKLEPYPDPRQFVPDGAPVLNVPIAAANAGSLTVGNDLFTYNDVFSGDQLVASGPDPASARFIRGVLLHDPEVAQVEVPLQPVMAEVMSAWTAAGTAWSNKFGETARELLIAITDRRVSDQIRQRALALLHAV